jgi:hypothetical protein
VERKKTVMTAFCKSPSHHPYCLRTKALKKKQVQKQCKQNDRKHPERRVKTAIKKKKKKKKILVRPGEFLLLLTKANERKRGRARERKRARERALTSPGQESTP